MAGSNTPMRTTLPPLAASSPPSGAASSEPLPPQAARPSIMAKASIHARNFFMLFILLFDWDKQLSLI